MGIAINNFASSTEDRASGAQVIDGSLRFDSSKSQYLTRTPNSAGNRKVWTLSCWLKLGSDPGHIFSANNDAFQFEYRSTGQLLFANSGSTSANELSTAVFRDYSSFYHLVIKHDATISLAEFYVNGVLNFTDTLTNADGTWNNNTSHNINGRSTSIDSFLDTYISQVYFIDGQALGPEYFGYTDPLTNTWRPKKYTITPTTVSWSGLPSGYSALDGTQYTGTLSNILTDDSNYISATNNDIDFDMGETVTASGKIIRVKWTSVISDSFSADYRIQTSNTSDFSVILESSVTLASENTTDFKEINFEPTQDFRYIRFNYVGGSRTARLYLLNIIAIGANSFYLPFDGSAPIGEDKSGNGNNWTPVNFNFGGSAALDKATGALPILNTFGSNGKTSLPSVRDDSAVGAAATCVLSLPLVGSANDVSNQINSGSTTKTVTVTNAVASSAQSNFYGGSWYFDGTGDWANVSGGSDFAFGTGDFTIECWAYTTTHTSSSRIISQDYDNNGSGNGTFLFYRSGSTMQFYSSNNGSSWDNVSGLTIGVIPVNTWTHLAVTRLNGTVYTWLNGIQQNSVSGSGNITNTGNVRIGCYGAGTGEFWNGYIQDLRIYNGVAKYTTNFIPASTNPDILPDTPSGVSYSSKLTKITDGAVSFDGSSDYLTTLTFSDFAYGTGDFTVEAYVYLRSTPSANIGIIDQRDEGEGTATKFTLFINTDNTVKTFVDGADQITTPAVVRPGAWHHIAYSRSGTTGRIFVDGILQASGTDSKDYSANARAAIGHHPTVSRDFPGSISNLRIIKGTALYTSNFTPPSAPLTDVTNTTLLCCKSNTSATAFDVSPGTITANGNAAATNFNPFTTDINAVRGQETGYATLNPLNIGTNVTLSDGNLKFTNGATEWNNVRGTIFVESGKWYCETVVTEASGNNLGWGVVQSDHATDTYIGNTSTEGRRGWVLYGQDGTSYTYYDGGNNNAAYTLADNDVLSMALDMDNGTIRWYRNGVLMVPTSGSNLDNVTGSVTFACTAYANGNTSTFNFGQNPFKFPPPEGFLPLNAANVRPSTVIARSDQYVGVTTYPGNGGTLTIGGLNFAPDLVWLKRTTDSNDHSLQDTVRGAGNNRLRTNQTNGENTQDGQISSFNSDGWTMGNRTNNSDKNYVAWCWKAGGNSNTFNIDDVGYATAEAAGLTGGTITPTGASVGTKQGFSIIGYAGGGSNGTISHGLGKNPSFMIFKDRDNDSTSWLIYHTSLGATKYLDFTDALANTSSNPFANTEPTSTVFTAGNWLDNTTNYIAYLWADVPGMQKFGSYIGNQNADGPYVELGFRPKILWIKSSSVGGGGYNWYIHDSERNKFNPTTLDLKANNANGEASTTRFDFLSSGFKIRGANLDMNDSGETFIYCAWAEAPSFNLYGAQANAR